MKKLSFIKSNSERHWVGDGFPVRNIFSYDDAAEKLSPFLLLDYAGPENFPPTSHKLGVGAHPHRGFETVTIVYDGEVEHRDSSGGGGKIGPGDVQWMTAASGIIHEEFHGRDYSKKGGPFEMVQLWVNLPSKHKMDKAAYQTLVNSSIPRLDLPEGTGVIRVIAGQYKNLKGPARTFSPMNVWDVRLQQGQKLTLPSDAGQTAAIFILKGKVTFQDGQTAKEAELAVFERDGKDISLEAVQEATLLFLEGTPLNEPIVGYGPFVMNSEAEIREAFSDFKSGKFKNL